MSVCFRRAHVAGWRRTGLHEDLHVDGVAESCAESSSLERARFGSRMCECRLRDCRLAGASAACARPFSPCANITLHVRCAWLSRNWRGGMLCFLNLEAEGFEVRGVAMVLCEHDTAQSMPWYQPSNLNRSCPHKDHRRRAITECSQRAWSSAVGCTIL